MNCRRIFKYWIADPLVGSLQWVMQGVLRMLPTPWVSDFGAWMSRFSPARYPASDARARRAWRLLRPEASDPAGTEAAVRRIWRSTGRLIAELPILDRLWAEGRITVRGLEHLERASASGRPVIVAAVHLGNWETIGVAGARLGFPGAGLALVLDNRFEDRLITRLRRRVGGRVIPALPTSRQAMVREIRERGPLLMYVDDFTRGVVRAPAFGRPLKPDGNIAYVVRLAKHTGALVVPAYCVRSGEEARFEITVLPALEMENTGASQADLRSNIARLDEIFEPIVRENLDQWFYVLDLDL
jgi:KDO2-lipid IV(A) lauroyltransferase